MALSATWPRTPQFASCRCFLNGTIVSVRNAADTWATFVWLLRLTSDVAPVYVLLVLLPLVALWQQGYRGALRAFAGVLLAHLGPLAMLLMGAAFYGEGRSNSVLGFVQLALGAAGSVLVIYVTKPLRGVLPGWAFTLFFFGVGILTVLTWLVAGMALADDWV